MDARPLILVGASGLAVEVAAAARRGGRRVVACLDDDPGRVGTLLATGVPILATTDALGTWEVLSDEAPSGVLICVGHGSVRRRVVERLEQSGIRPDSFTTWVDDRAVVPEDAVIGPGSIVLAGVVITAPISVGAHVVLMPHVILTHDVVVEDFATLAAGVALGGGARVRREAYLGMNATVRQGVTVSDLPDGQTWAGVPARRLS